jgi:hypothetical protein
LLSCPESSFSAFAACSGSDSSGSELTTIFIRFLIFGGLIFSGVFFGEPCGELFGFVFLGEPSGELSGLGFFFSDDVPFTVPFLFTLPNEL